MPEIRLLIVEDDPDVAELLTVFFARMEYRVFHAADGQEAIAVARARFPNLILLDVMLPDIDGWGVAETLRETPLTRHIPIIFLTQRNARSDRLTGLMLGADDYITKPFDVEELKLRVQGAIQRATRERLYEPRTGLPGASLIESEMERLRGQRGWHRLSVQVEGYGAFREVYGFMAADEALGYAARALLDTVGRFGTSGDFVGITDQDGFVVLTGTGDLDAFQQVMAETFKEKVRALYNFQDAERGFLVLNPGTEQEETVPLMHLRIENIA